MRVAILGTGNVGTDLLFKVRDSSSLHCSLFAGRRPDSPGLRMAAEHGIPVSDRGIDAVVDAAGDLDLVFDATSALDAVRHWQLLEPLGVSLVDLTPACLGRFCVPALNLDDCLEDRYVSMITCGGQAAVPMAWCMSQVGDLADVEIVSTAAAKSVGSATRRNLDEYLVATDRAAVELCGIPNPKTILVINPAEPGTVMRNTVAVPASADVDLDRLRDLTSEMADRIHAYVPGYRLAVPPVMAPGRLMITVEVEGRGDWLPAYAGNLDIITCAAVALADARAQVMRNRLPLAS